MKIFLSKCRYILVVLVFSFSPHTQAKQEISNSFLASAAIPIIGFVYSTTIHDYEGIKELVYSSLFTAQLTALLKHGVGRTRPNGQDDLSFPSGHASGSFMGASYLHHRYGLSWGLPMYAVASAISIQRVNVGAHYWTDVLAGAALGFISSYLFTVCFPNIWVSPTFNAVDHSVGLQFKLNF